MQTYLGGSGHFAFGFLVGYALLLLLLKIRHDKLSTHLYGPFIPLFTGIWAVMPYGFYQATEQLPAWLNIFFFYSNIHFNDYLIGFLGRAAYAVSICGSLFGLILLRYIRLYKYCKAYGWADTNGVSDAR